MQSNKETKKTKRKVVMMGISLPADLAEQADAKARQLYLSRSAYIRNLIFLDMSCQLSPTLTNKQN